VGCGIISIGTSARHPQHQIGQRYDLHSHGRTLALRLCRARFIFESRRGPAKAAETGHAAAGGTTLQPTVCYYVVIPPDRVRSGIVAQKFACAKKKTPCWPRVEKLLDQVWFSLGDIMKARL
jgi:hypothetical protein